MLEVTQTIPGSAGDESGDARHGLTLHLAAEVGRLMVHFALPEGWDEMVPLSLFVAWQERPAAEGGPEEEKFSKGSVVLPFGQAQQGSTVYIPFRANRVAWVTSKGEPWVQRWTAGQWSAPAPYPQCTGAFSAEDAALAMPFHGGKFVVYLKATDENEGWGKMIAASDPDMRWSWTGQGSKGLGDQVIASYWHLSEAGLHRCLRNGRERMRIYQLFVRLFGNLSVSHQLNGTLQENGCGKFNDISDASLFSLREMGFSHIWLMGVLQQATSTAYPGIPADDPDLLKGLAGSPYAVKNPIDLCPDYAANPARRLVEFKALVTRIHAAGLKVIIDFVPNHLARSFGAAAGAPSIDFSGHDDPRRFFDPRNHFYYLQPGDEGGSAPLRLPGVSEEGVAVSPTCQHLGGCDGLFFGEEKIGRVTGNNVVSWTPGIRDWYETVKLNYGYDFTTGRVEYPSATTPDRPIPDTWRKMDEVLAYWQSQGVDGFRCDMAHMVPPEFWGWAISRAQERARARMESAKGRVRCHYSEVVFIGEGYDNDPARVMSQNPALAAQWSGKGNTSLNLLDAGFDAVYDEPSYRMLKGLYDGPVWANDLDRVTSGGYITSHALCYAENHDEVRLAAAGEWGGIGMNVGRPVSAILYGLSRGPVLLYNGQEVGEGAAPAGFSASSSRTTIFDYWSMPELQKWVNGHVYDGGDLSADQRALRAFYERLLLLADRPAFRDGIFFPLNFANLQSRNFGRVHGESASGHWMYAYLRHDSTSGETFLVAVNLHREEAFRDVQIVIPDEALVLLGWEREQRVVLADRLSSSPALCLTMPAHEIILPVIPPLTPYYFEMTMLGR